jgi:hypothetical protein
MRTTKSMGPRGPRKVRMRTVIANALEHENNYRKLMGLPAVKKPKRRT